MCACLLSRVCKRSCVLVQVYEGAGSLPLLTDLEPRSPECLHQSAWSYVSDKNGTPRAMVPLCNIQPEHPSVVALAAKSQSK